MVRPVPPHLQFPTKGPGADANTVLNMLKYTRLASFKFSRAKSFQGMLESARRFHALANIFAVFRIFFHLRCPSTSSTSGIPRYSTISQWQYCSTDICCFHSNIFITMNVGGLINRLSPEPNIIQYVSIQHICKQT